MEQLSCVECGRAIRENKPTCEHCGHPIGVLSKEAVIELYGEETWFKTHLGGKGSKEIYLGAERGWVADAEFVAEFMRDPEPGPAVKWMLYPRDVAAAMVLIMFGATLGAVVQGYRDSVAFDSPVHVPVVVKQAGPPS